MGVKIRVLPERKYLLITDDNNRILILRAIYSEKIEPGEYNDPEDIVQIFKILATKGHETRREIENPRIIYSVIESILLQEKLPPDTKIDMIKKVIWGELHK